MTRNAYNNLARMNVQPSSSNVNMDEKSHFLQQLGLGPEIGDTEVFSTAECSMNL